ncbi:MAG: hypothetical protein ACREH3_16460, partial [Geminicoccales bacterium]
PIGRRSGCDCPTSTIIHAPQVERNHTSIAAQALHQGAAAPIRHAQAIAIGQSMGTAFRRPSGGSAGRAGQRPGQGSVADQEGATPQTGIAAVIAPEPQKA